MVTPGYHDPHVRPRRPEVGGDPLSAGTASVTAMDTDDWVDRNRASYDAVAEAYVDLVARGYPARDPHDRALLDLVGELASAVGGGPVVRAGRQAPPGRGLGDRRRHEHRGRDHATGAHTETVHHRGGRRGGAHVGRPPRQTSSVWPAPDPRRQPDTRKASRAGRVRLGWPRRPVARTPSRDGRRENLREWH